MAGRLNVRFFAEQYVPPGPPVRRRRDVATLALGVATLAATWAVALQRPIPPAEEVVMRRLNDLPEAGRLIWPVMQLGSLAAVPALAGLAYLKGARRLSASLLVSGSGAWVVAKWVKGAVERGRPDVYMPDIVVRQPTTGLGYVSGHAAVATALAVVAMPYIRKPWSYAIPGLVAVVGLGRIYFGLHLPLDVVGGMGLGAAIGGATNLLIGVESSPAHEAEGVEP
jgi:glycosyltransferase 2 family protein